MYARRVAWPSGAQIPGDTFYCMGNPVTGGSCACPSGFGDYSFMSGGEYDNSPWDSIVVTHYCMR